MNRRSHSWWESLNLDRRGRETAFGSEVFPDALGFRVAVEIGLESWRELQREQIHQVLEHLYQFPSEESAHQGHLNARPRRDEARLLSGAVCRVVVMGWEMQVAPSSRLAEPKWNTIEAGHQLAKLIWPVDPGYFSTVKPCLP